MLDLNTRDALLSILRVIPKVDPDSAWDLVYALSRLAADRREGSGYEAEAWKAIYRLASKILDEYREVWSA